MWLLLLPLFLPSRGLAAPEPVFTISSYTVLALASSPEVLSAYEAFSAADSAYKGQFSAMVLPTVAWTAYAYPYGYNPGNNYKYQTWRLSGSDLSFNTNVDINLFNGFQDLEKTKAAKLARESAERAYFAARQDRAFAAVSAFYDLDAKVSLTKVAQENLKAQDEQYRQSLDLYRNGMKSLADLLKSETDWRSSQLRLLTAQTDERRSLLAFNSLIDRPGLAPAELTASLQQGTTALPEVEGDAARAAAGRPEVVRAQKDLERAKVAVTQAYQGLLPTPRIDANWNHQDLATYGVPSSTLGIPNPNYNLGLTLSLPFGFNVLSQVYALAQAKAGRRQVEQALAAAIRQVRLEVYGAHLSLSHDVDAYAVALQKEDIARRTLDLVASQYREGTADAIRMNQAQTDLLDAQVERTQDQHQIFIDRAMYARAVGEPLW